VSIFFGIAVRVYLIDYIFYIIGQNIFGRIDIMCYKLPYVFEGALLVFFALVRYRMIKIVRSSSEVALRTKKYMMIYPDSDPSSKVITLHLTI
jgi:hypothetical protein